MTIIVIFSKYMLDLPPVANKGLVRDSLLKLPKNELILVVTGILSGGCEPKVCQLQDLGCSWENSGCGLDKPGE